MTRDDPSGGTTITSGCTTSTTARITTNNYTRSSEKREEMPQELPCWRREFETSNPVGVRAKEIEKQKNLRTEGLKWTLENDPEVHLDD